MKQPGHDEQLSMINCRDIAGSHRNKSNLLQGGGTSILHASVKGRQNGQHAVDIAVTKIQTAGFLQCFMPLLMPQDGHANQLCADLHSGHTHTAP